MLFKLLKISYFPLSAIYFFIAMEEFYHSQKCCEPQLLLQIKEIPPLDESNEQVI